MIVLPVICGTSGMDLGVGYPLLNKVQEGVLAFVM